MNSLMQVQQDMLGRMEQIKGLSEGAAIKPAQIFEAQPAEGFATAFDSVLYAVNEQQIKASEAAAAVDSGKSDDLLGAMIDSQKASVSFSALLQVRNKLTSAFEEVMRMPM
ncbi:flagellar hook-basal body complex protein FliE [Pseudomonas sp. ok272]|uniref:flagellar hook-basal body complex protein FliE n=1 Tax=unclassified Pseudomonas TaxID=196821 RepID=UPI0008B76E2A|nr:MULTISPECIES: flagellar hook-basal body complex protein FliE [unclassified Pseudomonas]SEM63309.1 flagellar hook-basal body complex protein FliE [Pseudomonas sp. ok272]SFM46684.1 flagellar hook-basal body complex protein FliE [Pseudomonas sp. ok602]